MTWQPTGFLEDGRVLLLSLEARRDGPGRPFDEYYHQTPTHVWAYDLDRNHLEELATRDRMAPFYAPQLVLRDGRLLMQVIRTRPGQTFNMRLDGSDARECTGPDEGLPYGHSLSPDGRRVAFHLASRDGYQIWTSDTLGGDR
ncbi:MAG: serine/threonine protein kinase, partial [Verrucomicrobia bacterium]|nr:serine/threonine protein kinase [Verrucomicrobiota bacterium]